MESLKGSLSDMMVMFQDRMSRFEAELQGNTPSDTTVGLAAEFTTFKSFILEALGCLQRQVETLAQEVDMLETRGRRKMLLLHGVAEETNENTSEVVTGVVQDKLHIVDFTSSAIRRCHRMGRQSNPSKPRPICVKFVDVDIRDKIWFSKTQLKGSGVTASEFLTRSRHRVFMAARERFGVNSCWTKQGVIYILGADGSRHRVVTISELMTIAGPEVDADKPVVAAAVIVPKKRRAAANKKP